MLLYFLVADIDQSFFNFSLFSTISQIYQGVIYVRLGALDPTVYHRKAPADRWYHAH